MPRPEFMSFKNLIFGGVPAKSSDFSVKLYGFWQ